MLKRAGFSHLQNEPEAISNARGVITFIKEYKDTSLQLLERSEKM